MSEELQDQTKLFAQQDAEFPIKPTLVEKIKGWRASLGTRWAQLHTNQIIYIIALFLLFTVDGDLKEPNTLIWYVGVLAFFGMARELWAIFKKVWESTFGRLVLLVIYAAIANFTLAVAAQKVNNIINADPTQLYHTLGVTTLLVLPLWLMVFSVVGMIVIFGLMQILRLFRGLLVLIRIIGKKTQPKEAFPKTFILIRLVLLAPVSMTMLTLLEWYSEQLNLPDTPWLSFSNNSDEMFEKNMTKMGLNLIEKELQKNNLSEQELAELKAAKQALLDGTAKDINLDAMQKVAVTDDASLDEPQSEQVLPSANKATAKVYFLDNLIASFVYNYETFSYSHCQKEANERVVYISDDDILVAKKDENTSSGYSFTTRTCVVEN